MLVVRSAFAADPTIVVLGDSLSSGYGLNGAASWVTLLDRRLSDEGYEYAVVNASIAGDTSAVVHADHVTWNEDEDRLEARGNVIVDAVNGHRIESEHLRWNDMERMLRTPGFARITMDDEVWEGYGLTADEALENVELFDVTSTFEVADE